MKKLFVIALALVMVLAMATTVFAADNGLREEKANVTFTYVAGEAAEDTYAIDIEWDSFNFTYQQAPQVWNPETHQNEDADETSGWLVDSANVVVTNNSNIDVVATIEYVAAETANGTATAALTAGAGANTLAAAGETVASVTATLTVSGVPAADAAAAVIGEVVVTITGVLQ